MFTVTQLVYLDRWMVVDQRGQSVAMFDTFEEAALACARLLTQAA